MDKRETPRRDRAVAFSIDFEGYTEAMQESFRIPSGYPRFDIEAELQANTDRCLSLFGERHVRATFFVLGWIAERFPSIVRAIANAGHEIGSHSYFHQRLTDASPARLDEVRRSREILEDVSGWIPSARLLRPGRRALLRPSCRGGVPIRRQPQPNDVSRRIRARPGRERDPSIAEWISRIPARNRFVRDTFRPDGRWWGLLPIVPLGCHPVGVATVSCGDDIPPSVRDRRALPARSSDVSDAALPSRIPQRPDREPLAQALQRLRTDARPRLPRTSRIPGLR